MYQDTNSRVRQSVFCAFVVCFFVTLFVAGVFAQKERAKEQTAPTVKSIFPLGGSEGSRFDALIRGKNLEGAYAVWLDCDSIRAKVKEVREIDLIENEGEPGVPGTETELEKETKGHQVAIEVEIDPSANLGAHTLRLLTAKGLSNALWFLVDSEAVVHETNQSHSSLTEAQPINLAVIVNGKLAEPGELDYYSFEVERDQELQLEVRAFALQGDAEQLADPQLILYRPTGSWFDPDRGVRLEVTDLWRPPLGKQPFVTSHRLPRVRRVFEKAGRYVAKVGTVGGGGGPDYAYQLRIVPVSHQESERHRRWGPITQAAHSSGPIAWESRDFTSRIGADWLGRISSRSASAIESPELSAVTEKEPNDVPTEALKVSVPVIVEGIIGQSADVDWFTIEVKAGEKLAFEIETPYLPPPFFNARVTAFDPDGKELASNVYRGLGGDGDDWIKTLVPKILYAFDKDGQYQIQVRDLTSRVGGRDFTYRLVIRPQVPHLGEVAAREVDNIRLTAGESRSINVITELEEGFQGDVALTVENLPPGVTAATAVSASDKRNRPTSKPGGQLYRDRHFPQQHSVSIALMATSSPPPTLLPQPIRIVARPILEGRTGEALLAQEILLTVADQSKQGEAGPPGADSP